MTTSQHDLATPRSGHTGRALRGSRPEWIDAQAPQRSVRRYRAVRAFVAFAARLFSTVRCEGTERLPAGSSVLCFSHQNWADPFYIFAAIPMHPRLYFFGPKQEEMRRGFRNRWMRWGGVVIPYRPGQRGLVAATARVDSLLAGSATVAIAGEGQIHLGERNLLPLHDGPAYLSLRAGVPLVPVAINGTSWLGFRRVVRVRVGIPIVATPKTAGRPDRKSVV
jgi:1-acyl-sn-glycerol-3-phosphate acyltransferase